MYLVSVVGVEPTRLSATVFETVSSACSNTPTYGVVCPTVKSLFLFANTTRKGGA